VRRTAARCAARQRAQLDYPRPGARICAAARVAGAFPRRWQRLRHPYRTLGRWL